MAWVQVLALAVGLALAAGCGVTYNTLPLSVSPASIAFGSVPVGQNATETVTIGNPSLKPVTLSGIQSADPAFAVASQAAVTIPGGGSAQVRIVFSPGSARDYSTQLVVASSGGQTTVPVSGTGAQAAAPAAEAALSASSTEISFGSVPIGGAAQQTVTLTSSGAAPLVIGALQTSGAGFSAAVSGLPATLAPGQSITVPISFGPTAAGSASGRLVVASNAAATPSFAVALTGSGGASVSAPGSGAGVPALSLGSPSVGFGSVAVGDQSAQSLVLTSSGTAPLVISAVSIEGAAFRAASPSLPLTLAPGQQIALPLTFAPLAAGTQQGTLTLADNTAAGSASVPLSGIGASSSTLSVPASVGFGDVTAGSSGSKTVTLTAAGNVPITVTDIRASGAGFALPALGLPQALAPGQQMSVRVAFAPSAEGPAAGALLISSSATTDPSATVALSGSGVASPSPALSASATRLSFGSVAVHSPASQQVTVTSTGTAPATLVAATVAGPGYSATYAGLPVQDPGILPLTLPPGAKAVFDVIFDPASAGASSGQFSLATDTGTPIAISLDGQGTAGAAPALLLSDAALDFGEVQIGREATAPLRVSSTGSAPLTLSGASVAGHDFRVAAVSGPSGGAGWPVTLAPGQQVVLTVAFTPDAGTSFAGSLSLASDAAGGSVNVPLSGSGIAVPVASLELSSQMLSFGSVPLGSSATQSITLTSSGSAPLTLTSIQVAGSQFRALQPGLPLTLAPGQQLVLPVAFTPAEEAPAGGSLTFMSNASGGAVTVALGGSGSAAPSPRLSVSSAALDFGDVPVGATVPRTLTVSSSGNAPLVLTAGTLAGAGYSWSGATLPATLNPGQSLPLLVQFAPGLPGPSNGLLTLASNSSTGPSTTIQLSGSGVASSPLVPRLQTSAPSLAFGNVDVGATATLPLTLISAGSAPLTIQSLTLAGPGFSVSGATLPLTLSPGQSLSLEVQFDPAAAGAASGMLTIVSNSSTGPTRQIPISGSGSAAPHWVDLNWEAPVDSSDPVAGYYIYRSLGSAAPVRLNTSPEPALLYTDTTVQSGMTYHYQVTSVDAAGVEGPASNQIALTIP